MSANRQIVRDQVDHRVPFKSTKNAAVPGRCPLLYPNSRRWMRRIYHGPIQSGRPRLQTRVRTTQNYSACLIEGMVHNSHALSRAGVAHGSSFAEDVRRDCWL